jgi:hypothetical protein
MRSSLRSPYELNASDLLKAAYAARERTACRLLVIIVGIA